MKTTKDLFRIMATATESSMHGYDMKEQAITDVSHSQWFFSYSGHVNSLSATMYPLGWSDAQKENGVQGKSLDAKLTEAGIQLMYWFIYDNLSKNKQQMMSNLSVTEVVTK